jgi:hypothetical protein
MTPQIFFSIIFSQLHASHSVRMGSLTPIATMGLDCPEIPKNRFSEGAYLFMESPARVSFSGTKLASAWLNS